MEEESGDGEDCVEFVNIKSHSKDCDVRQGIPDELLSLFTKILPFSLPYYLSTQVKQS